MFRAIGMRRHTQTKERRSGTPGEHFCHVVSSGQCCGYFLRIRRARGGLPDDKLEESLTNLLLQDAIMCGMAQLVFLAFSSLKYWNKNDRSEGTFFWYYKISFYSQIYVGGMVSVHIVGKDAWKAPFLVR